MTRILLAILCVASVSGCARLDRLNPFNRTVAEAPLPFNARISASRRSPDFTVSVATRGAPIDAWRESARHPATGFCLRRFGTSDIDWVTRGGPDDWAQQPGGRNGGVIVRGRCNSR